MTRQSTHEVRGEKFSAILQKELESARLRLERPEKEIAREAGIDPSTLSLLKHEKDRRIGNPSVDVRLRLAIALAEPSKSELLAERFLRARPQPEMKEGGDWRKKFRKLRAKLFQTDIGSIEFGLPLFFDTAPFLIADKNGYFDEIGLRVTLNYVKWHQTLPYLVRRRKSGSDGLRVSVYNLVSIGDEPLRDSIAFCFPLSIYHANGFALLVRSATKTVDEYAQEHGAQNALRGAVAEFMREAGPDMKIIVAGTDMKRGAEAMFVRAGVEVAQLEHSFVVLDQFDALETFLSGLGDAFVGGIPQRIKAMNEGAVKLFVSGDHHELRFSKQFNGIVTSWECLGLRSGRKAISQLLWGWYQALDYVEENLRDAAQFIVEEMNIYAGRIKYKDDDFEKFWKSREYFEPFPRTPQEMEARLVQKSDYPYKPYDETNSFREVLKQIQLFLPRP